MVQLLEDRPTLCVPSPFPGTVGALARAPLPPLQLLWRPSRGKRTAHIPTNALSPCRKRGRPGKDSTRTAKKPPSGNASGKMPAGKAAAGGKSAAKPAAKATAAKKGSRASRPSAAAAGAVGEMATAKAARKRSGPASADTDVRRCTRFGVHSNQLTTLTLCQAGPARRLARKRSGAASAELDALLVSLAPIAKLLGDEPSVATTAKARRNTRMRHPVGSWCQTLHQVPPSLTHTVSMA